MFIVLVILSFNYYVHGSDIRTMMYSRQCLQSDTPGIYKRSRIACGQMCLQKPNTCRGFIFDKIDNTCKVLDDGDLKTCKEHPVGSQLESYIMVS